MRSKWLALDEYAEFCSACDVGACYGPSIVEYCYARLGRRPRIRGRFNQEGELVAAYPVLYGFLFPNPLLMRLLRRGRRFPAPGDIGQPEALFPVRTPLTPLPLNCLSQYTSPLLKGAVRGAEDVCRRPVVIAARREHKRDSRKLRQFLAGHGSIVPSRDVDAREFADVFIRLHCARWQYPIEEFGPVREQIVSLYRSVFGILLFERREPVGAHFCLKHEGRSFVHVESINIGVKPHSPDETAYGSLLLLASLRSAEETAARLGKGLRYNYGYDDQDYKVRWGEPQRTFIAF